MAFEHDFQIAAEYHQAELLAEAAARRMNRTETRREDPLPATNRLQSLLRRIAGAPTYACTRSGSDDRLTYHGGRGDPRLEPAVHRAAS